MDTQPCTCHEVHNSNGCTHPQQIYELQLIYCTGGGGTQGGASTTPGTSGTYGGPTGNPTNGGYTGFVLGDGSTGNQSDVDALNQFTAQMDAAFGMGNWSFDDNVNAENSTYNLSNLNDFWEKFETLNITEISSSSQQINLNTIRILKRVRISDNWGNSVNLDISCHYNLSNYMVSNINSQISGITFGFDWEQFGTHAAKITFDNPNTPQNETKTRVTIDGYLKYTLFWEGFGTIGRSPFTLNFDINADGSHSPVFFYFNPNEQ